MNSLAFLIMLAGFAAVAGWYILNVERGQDGTDGFLAILSGNPKRKGRRESRAIRRHLARARLEAEMGRQEGYQRVGGAKWHQRDKKPLYHAKKDE